ncbi:hypothetical protein EDB80DRAFT_674891 [Ilyonectria destructans]|nr:hypothetical protein EDB80DRAFT_674891 [Ilyonectria destructans]
MSAIGCFPNNVEFRVELRVLLATTRDFRFWGFLDPETFLHRAGRSIKPPPEAFSYVPPELRDPQGKPMSNGRSKGWVLFRLAHSLNKRGLTTNWTMPDGATLHSGPRVEPGKESATDTDGMWMISYDEDINEHQDPEYSWVGVKITSPVYTPGPSLFKGLPEVIHVLTNKFIAIVNADTHLGVLARPTKGKLELEGLRTISSLLWTADPILSTLHPPHCGPGSLRALGLQFSNLAENQRHIDVRVQLASADRVPDPWDNRISPDRQPLSLITHPGELSAPKFRHGLNRIQNANDFSELVHLLDLVPIIPDGDRRQPRPAYDFRGLTDCDRGMVGFNQHCGTLDLDAICHWACVCAFLVSAGIGKPQARIQNDLTTLQREVQQQKVSLVDFFTKGGLEDVAKYYQRSSPAIEIPDFTTWPKLKKGVPGHNSEPIVKPGTLPLRVGQEINKTYLNTLGKQLDKWDKSAKLTDNSCYTIGVELEMQTPSSGQTEEEKAAIVAEIQSEHWFESEEEAEKFHELWGNAARQVHEDPDPEDGRDYAGGLTFETRSQQVIQMVKKNLGVFFYNPGTIVEYSGIDPITARKKMFAEEGGSFCDPEYEAEWQAWGVKEDLSLGNSENWKGYAGLNGLELVSPILRDTPECWESILDILAGMRRTMRLVVDQRCGVHVSVGKGTDPMPLHFYRKLSCLMYCVDPVIFSLCRPDRGKSYGFSRPLRSCDGVGLVGYYDEKWENCAATKDFFEHFPVDELSSGDQAILKKLWMAPSNTAIEDLIIRGGARSCVSILRVKKSPVPGYFTGAVEFRHLEGSLDPELILRFGQLLVALFQFADQAAPEAWQELIPILMKCTSPKIYDLDVLRILLVKLGLGDDFGYWAKQVGKNWVLPSAQRMTEWLRDDPAGYLNSLEVERPISSKHVESIRQNVCRRQRKPEYMIQKPDNGPTKPPGVISVREEMKGRTESLLKIVSPTKSIPRVNLEHVLSTAAEVWPGSQRGPRDTPPEASRGRETGLRNLLVESQKKAQTLADQELSNKELDTFARLDCRNKNGQDFLDLFPQLESPMLEVDITEKEWELFLGGH